jgi:hypothetical protein
MGFVQPGCTIEILTVAARDLRLAVQVRPTLLIDEADFGGDRTSRHRALRIEGPIEGRRLVTFDELEAESKPCANCGLYSHHQQCPRCNMPRKAEPLNPTPEPTSGE